MKRPVSLLACQHAEQGAYQVVLLLPERLCRVVVVRPDLRAWHLPRCRRTVHAALPARFMCMVIALLPVHSTCTVMAAPICPGHSGCCVGQARGGRELNLHMSCLKLCTAGGAVCHLHNSPWLLFGEKGDLTALTLCPC